MLGTVTAALDTRTDGPDSGGPPLPSPHPALLILHKLLPVLKVTASVWCHDSLVMQVLPLKICLFHCMPYLHLSLRQLMTLKEATCRACLLRNLNWLASAVRTFVIELPDLGNFY